MLDRFSAEERKNIGIHTCPGGDCDSTHSADVDYADLLPSMFKMNAGYFLIQLASERDKERSTSSSASTAGDDANGVAAGLLHRRDQSAEPAGRDAQEVCDDLVLPPSTSPRSASAPPTTAASRRSAST